MKTSKRVLSVLLVALMLLTSAPLGGVTDWFSNRASAAGGVSQKLQQVVNMFPDGSNFTVNGNCCPAGHGSACSNCYYPNVVNKRLGWGWTNMYSSYSCYGFSCFVTRYIFGTEWPRNSYVVGTANLSNTTACDNLLNQAKIGDVVSIGTSHRVIFLQKASNGMIVYDSNQGDSSGLCNKVRYWKTTTYSGMIKYYGKVNLELRRMNNYNEIDGGSSSGESLKTPTISFNKSYYSVGEQVTFSWTASPSSVLSHYWVIVDLPGGSSWISTRIDKSVTSYSFTPDREGSYYVYVAATPYGSQSGEGSLEDRKNVSVTSFFSFDVNTYVDDVAYNLGHTNVTFDVYINGACVANDVIDYYQSFAKGTTYLVNDIKTSGGYVLTGNTSFSGVINSNISITPRVKSHTHSYTSKVTKSPTCTATGVKTYTCSCGDSYTETIAKTAHSYTSKTITSTYLKSGATCTSPAVYYYKCASCSAKGTATYTYGSALGHTESDWIFDGDGTKHTECTVCHAVLRTEETEECDHSEKRSEYIVTPTCTKPGKLVYICDLCDKQLGEEDVEPLGHSYVGAVTKATLSKNGAVTQTCSDCGAKKTVRTIYYPKTFAVAAQVYTGKALKPAVTVKDSAGKTVSSANYTVTYANNVAIGTATVKVTFKGNYSGTKTLTFAIVPAQVSKPKATQTTSSITLSWSKVAGSNMRYYVFSYNSSTKKYTCLGYTTGTSYTVKKLSSGTTYNYAVQAYNTTAKKWGKVSSVLTTATKPGTPTLKAVAGTRKATLSWNKQNGATGYLLYMATSKNGKYTRIATLNGSSRVSFTKTGLTKGRTYYFKVIAYKTVGSTNIYGAYSSVKYVKVK